MSKSPTNLAEARRRREAGNREIAETMIALRRADDAILSARVASRRAARMWLEVCK